MEKTECAEDHEVQDADAATLKREGVSRPGDAQHPANNEERDASGGSAGEPKLDRNVDALVGVLEQEGDAEKQDDHADLDDDVAAEEPLPKGRPRRNSRDRFGLRH